MAKPAALSTPTLDCKTFAKKNTLFRSILKDNLLRIFILRFLFHFGQNHGASFAPGQSANEVQPYTSFWELRHNVQPTMQLEKIPSTLHSCKIWLAPLHTSGPPYFSLHMQ